jgi:hypothetical protein
MQLPEKYKEKFEVSSEVAGMKGLYWRNVEVLLVFFRYSNCLPINPKLSSS